MKSPLKQMLVVSVALSLALSACSTSESAEAEGCGQPLSKVCNGNDVNICLPDGTLDIYRVCDEGKACNNGLCGGETGGEAVPIGQCANDNDRPLIESNAVFEDTGDCGQACGSDLNESDYKSCHSKCYAELISSECADCLVNFLYCIDNGCSDCLTDKKSPECKHCFHYNCFLPYIECAGVDLHE